MGPPVVHADVDHHMLLLKLSQEAERAQALFKEWDVNDSGTVSVEEFHRALGALGIGGAPLSRVAFLRPARSALCA